MKCLMKYEWVKLMRSHLPRGKGVMGAWARLASRASFRKGKAEYCDDKTMLIDGGKPSASGIIYTYLKNLNIGYVDYIVASHADDDHIGGLSALINGIIV